jgi:integrase
MDASCQSRPSSCSFLSETAESYACSANRKVDDLWLWKQECPDSSPGAFIFPNTDGGFMDTGNCRNRILTPLAEKLGLPKLNFQVLRTTMATLAQGKGSVKDIQAHLRHSQADTTANEYMQELPESVGRMSNRCTRS